MPLPPDLPVVDHHCHLSPSGEGIAAARRFAAAGGTHLFLATQNYSPGVPLSAAGYAEQFATHRGLIEAITRETGVTAYSVVAPHPTDLPRAVEALGLEAAIELQRAALELAAREVEEQRAVALGEVGRIHFPVDPALAEAVEGIFVRALELGRDLGCPIVVHSEDLDADGFRRLAGLAAQVGFPPGKLVKHYARTIVPAGERLGVVPSYLARRELATASLPIPGPWFWETDFLDDPTRPGAVLDLATVPRRATAAAASAEGREALRVPFVESVESVYGFTPRVGGRDR